MRIQVADRYPVQLSLDPRHLLLPFVRTRRSTVAASVLSVVSPTKVLTSSRNNSYTMRRSQLSLSNSVLFQGPALSQNFGRENPISGSRLFPAGLHASMHAPMYIIFVAPLNRLVFSPIISLTTATHPINPTRITSSPLLRLIKNFLPQTLILVGIRCSPSQQTNDMLGSSIGRGLTGCSSSSSKRAR